MDKTASIIHHNMLAMWRWVSQTGYIKVHDEKSLFYTYAEPPLPDPCFNSVLMSTETSSDIEQHMRDMMRIYQKRGVPFSWWLSPDDRAYDLAGHHFYHFGQVPGMMLKPNQQETPQHSVDIPSVDVRIVEKPRDFELWIPALAESFHLSEKGVAAYQKMLSHPHCFNEEAIHLYAMHRQQAVSCLSLIFDGPRAGIYNAATAEAFRKRGLSTMLTQKAIDYAWQKSCTDICLQASPESTSLFTSLGFKTYLTYDVFVSPQNL